MNRRYIPLPIDDSESESDVDDFISKVHSKYNRQEAILIDTSKPGSTYPFPTVIHTKTKHSNPVCCASCVIFVFVGILLSAVGIVFILAIPSECSFCGLLVKESPNVTKEQGSGRITPALLEKPSHVTSGTPILTTDGTPDIKDKVKSGEKSDDIFRTESVLLPDSVAPVTQATHSKADDRTTKTGHSQTGTVSKRVFSTQVIHTASYQNDEDGTINDESSPTEAIISRFLAQSAGIFSTTAPLLPSHEGSEDDASLHGTGMSAGPSEVSQVLDSESNDGGDLEVKDDIAKFLADQGKGSTTTKTPVEEANAEMDTGATESVRDEPQTSPQPHEEQTVVIDDSHIPGERTDGWTIEVPGAGEIFYSS
jgi:hypothetical protein